MKKIVLVLFVIIATPFVLIGQDLDTTCDGRDFWTFCLVKERSPDTIWMEISNPVEITLTIDLDIEYNQKQADTAGWCHAHVRQASSIWAEIIDTSGTRFPFTRYFSGKWMCYGDEIPSTDTVEMEKIIETVLRFARKNFVGYPCKVRELKGRKDVKMIERKCRKCSDKLLTYVHSWVFPKEKNVDLR